MTTSTIDVVCEITGSIQRCNDPVRVYSFIVTDIAIILITIAIIYKFVTADHN